MVLFGCKHDGGEEERDDNITPSVGDQTAGRERVKITLEDGKNLSEDVDGYAADD